MKLVLPNNIYSTLFILAFDQNKRPDLEVKEASLILNEVLNDNSVVGVIPSLDLIKNRELNVSKKIGISFENLLSNSYLYFGKKNDNLDKLYLRGDVSINEVLLSKIVFQEKYNLSPEISLDTSEDITDNNYHIIGSDNWTDDKFKYGTSFSEQISDLIDLPYVNFIFVSRDEEVLKNFNSEFSEVSQDVLIKSDENLSKIGMSETVNEFILKNLNSLTFDLKENSIDGLTELIALMYYHQISDDLFDIKFVE